MTPRVKKDLRALKLGALFAEAKKRGIDGEQLRSDIAPGQLGKRLSKASAIEIQKLIDYIAGGSPGPRTPDPGPSRYNRPLMNGFKERYDDLGIRPGYATPAQLRMIESMWMDVSRMRTFHDRVTALNSFLKRVIGVEKMDWVEAWQVQKVVNAINHMQPRHGDKS